MAISDWPIQGLTTDLLRRELYDSHEGDWDFFNKKKTKFFLIWVAVNVKILNKFFAI